ncbi:hypothetical protein MMPV_000358 [Pyropia vietnamensis]
MAAFVPGAAATLGRRVFLGTAAGAAAHPTPRASVAATRRTAMVTMESGGADAEGSAPQYTVGDIPDVLVSILERKKDEVAALKAEVAAAGDDHPIAALLASGAPRSKAFVNALRKPPGCLSVIGEIKRRSPSKGLISDIKDPALLSRHYNEAGAAAISVLTDGPGFGGSMADLEAVVKEQARKKGQYPGPSVVLRKEFIIDPVQIAEAAVSGAHAVLLIVAALGEARTGELLAETHRLGLDAIVEVHDDAELAAAVAVGAEIIGVNNRDLRTFEVSLETAERLRAGIPEGVIAVAESGIEECLDAWRLRDMGYSAILVGEALVKAADNSKSDGHSYSSGYNNAKGLIKAFLAKGSVKYGPSTTAAFYGKGEGAKESLGEMSI